MRGREKRKKKEKIPLQQTRAYIHPYLAINSINRKIKREKLHTILGVKYKKYVMLEGCWTRLTPLATTMFLETQPTTKVEISCVCRPLPLLPPPLSSSLHALPIVPSPYNSTASSLPLQLAHFKLKRFPLFLTLLPQHRLSHIYTKASIAI